MSYNKQILLSSLALICFILFLPTNTHAFNPKILKHQPEYQQESIIFKDCPKYRINRDITINKKNDITTILRNNNITYGMPIHCIKNRNSAIKFFMSHRAIGISFSINK